AGEYQRPCGAHGGGAAGGEPADRLVLCVVVKRAAAPHRRPSLSLAMGEQPVGAQQEPTKNPSVLPGTKGHSAFRGSTHIPCAHWAHRASRLLRAGNGAFRDSLMQPVAASVPGWRVVFTAERAEESSQPLALHCCRVPQGTRPARRLSISQHTTESR